MDRTPDRTNRQNPTYGSQMIVLSTPHCLHSDCWPCRHFTSQNMISNTLQIGVERFRSYRSDKMRHGYDACDRILQDRTNATRSVIFENVWNHILRYQVPTVSAITVSTTGVFRTIISASEVEFLELVVSNVACLSHDVVWCRMQNRREMMHFSQKWRRISKIGDVGLPEW